MPVEENIVPTERPETFSTQEVDTENSLLTWNAKKVGGEHYGRVYIQSWILDFDEEGNLIWWDVVIDMNTITVDDLEEGSDMHGMLLNHLRSEDFFSVELYPLATLFITQATLISPNTYEINADLDIKNISNPISFVATIDENWYFNAPIVIDRTLRDITFRSLRFFSNIADNAINDEINFTVSVAITHTKKKDMRTLISFFDYSNL